MRLTATITVGSNETNIKMNAASLETPLRLTGTPIFLLVHYFTDLDSAHANFIVEIRDDENNLLWDTQLKDTNSSIKKSLYVLPDDVSGKQANLDGY